MPSNFLALKFQLFLRILFFLFLRKLLFGEVVHISAEITECTLCLFLTALQGQIHTHTQCVTKSVSQGLACFLRPDKVKACAQNRVTKLRLQREQVERLMKRCNDRE